MVAERAPSRSCTSASSNMADSLAPDFLSVDSVASAQTGQVRQRIEKQAANNVARQSFAKSIRGDDVSSGPPPKSKAAPKAAAPTPAQTQKEEDKSADQKRADAQKKAIRLISKCQQCKAHPVLGPRISDIQLPRGGHVPEWEATWDLIRERLGQCSGENTIKVLYLQLLQVIDPLVASPAVPDKIRIPYGSSNYCAMQMRTLDAEFAELAIEYGEWFNAGPLSRLFRGTVQNMLQYKYLVEKGDPVLGEPSQSHSGTSEGHGETSEGSAFAEPEQTHRPPGLSLPPPMKVYPDPLPEERQTPVPPPFQDRLRSEPQCPGPSSSGGPVPVPSVPVPSVPPPRSVHFDLPPPALPSPPRGLTSSASASDSLGSAGSSETVLPLPGKRGPGRPKKGGR